MSVYTGSAVTAPTINADHTFKAGTIMINSQAYDVMATFIRDGQSIRVTPEILANQDRMDRINALAQEKLQPMVNKDTFKDKVITIIDGRGAKIDDDCTNDIPHVAETKQLWTDYKAKLYKACLTPLEKEAESTYSRGLSGVDYRTPPLTVQGTLNQSADGMTSICFATAANFLDRVLALRSNSELGESLPEAVDNITITGADKHQSIIHGRDSAFSAIKDQTLSGDEVALHFSDTLLNLSQSWRQSNTPVLTGIQQKDINHFLLLFNNLQFYSNTPVYPGMSVGATVTVNGRTFAIAVLKPPSAQHEYLIYDSHGLLTSELGQRGPAFLRISSTSQDAATFIVTSMISVGISISNHSTGDSLSLESLKSRISDSDNAAAKQRVYLKVYSMVVEYNKSADSEAKIVIGNDNVEDREKLRWVECHALDDAVRPFFRTALLEEDTHKDRDRIAVDMYSRFSADPLQLQRAFDQLHKTDQDIVDRIVKDLAGNPEDMTGRWGADHRTDNAEFFRKALTTVCNEHVLHLNPEI